MLVWDTTPVQCVQMMFITPWILTEWEQATFYTRRFLVQFFFTLILWGTRRIRPVFKSYKLFLMLSCNAPWYGRNELNWIKIRVFMKAFSKSVHKNKCNSNNELIFWINDCYARSSVNPKVFSEIQIPGDVIFQSFFQYFYRVENLFDSTLLQHDSNSYWIKSRKNACTHWFFVLRFLKTYSNFYIIIN